MKSKSLCSIVTPALSFTAGAGVGLALQRNREALPNYAVGNVAVLINGTAVAVGQSCEGQDFVVDAKYMGIATAGMLFGYAVGYISEVSQ